jgi:hypothetical protein
MKLFWLLLITLFVGGKSIWIGEEFWTIVNYDGTLYGGRTFDDFIRFRGIDVNRFVAYWITAHNAVDINGAPVDRTIDNQWEAYGEAFLRGGRVCAKFIDKDDQPTEICGGFRVLSRGVHDGANPFEWHSIRQISHHQAVEYLNHQIAQIWHSDRLQSVYGGAHLDRGTAYAVALNGTPIHIRRDIESHFYDLNVDLLTVKNGYIPKQYIHVEGASYRHRNGLVFTPDDILRRVALTTDACLNLNHDLDGDGIVDSREAHICRYGRNGCDLRIYDVNKDQYLDEDEVADCLKYLNLHAQKYPRAADSPTNECHHTRYDTNGDGYIDSRELYACRHGRAYTPSDTKLSPALSSDECHHLRYDLNGDGVVDRNEIAECRRRTDRHHSEYCRGIQHDLNNDGIIDAYELEKCRQDLFRLRRARHIENSHEHHDVVEKEKETEEVVYGGKHEKIVEEKESEEE